MLYNVLPPIVFFVSLGGIIVVISRVVLRLRQQQLATDLQSHIARVSRTRLNKVQDLAGLLAPNQISVQSFKNRLSFLVHATKNSWRKMWQDISDWREHRAKQKSLLLKSQHQPKPAAPAPASSTAPSSVSQPGAITRPHSVIRTKLTSVAGRVRQIKLPNLSRLASPLKNKISQLFTHPSLQRQARTSTPERAPDADLADPVEAVATIPAKQPPKLRVVDNAQPITSAKPSPVMEKMGQTIKAGSLSQLFKKELKMAPLQEAAEALEKQQAKRAEDLLVPYIIKHPRDTNAYMMLGKAAVSRHAWKEATEIFEQVIKLKPDTEGCYAALGQVALEAGNLTKAIETLQRAHDQNPQNITVIKCLLQIAHRMDNWPLQQSLNLELQQLEQSSVPATQP